MRVDQPRWVVWTLGGIYLPAWSFKQALVIAEREDGTPLGPGFGSSVPGD